MTVSRGNTWLFAHNLPFDLTICDLWGEVSKGNYQFAHWSKGPERSREANAADPGRPPMVVLGDPPTIIGLINKRGHKIICVDTLNYYRCSLAELGRNIGFPKHTMPDPSAPDEVWFRYCSRDCEILLEAVTRLVAWWEKGGYGNWSHTAPGLAMHAYRHKFMKYPLHAHDEGDIRLLERAAYYGGRLEAFWLGPINGPSYLIDINSLYPAVMACNQFPTQLWDWELRNDYNPKPPPYPPNECIADVFVDTPDPCYPFRTRKGVIYPVGRFATCLCGPELAEAVSRGHVVSWGTWSYYCCSPIFAEYVAHFWEQKKQAELDCRSADALLAKLMLNSLYGKFGQKGGRWTYQPDMPPRYEYTEWPMRDADTGQNFRYLSLYDRNFKHDEPAELRKSIPQISAWVASAARAYMLRAIELAGLDHTYYVSTDALIVDSKGMTRLENEGFLHPQALGLFRIKAFGMNAHIGGLHQYRVGDKVIFGAVPNGITPDRYGRWESTEFEGLCETIGRGAQPTIATHRVVKSLQQAYDRRKVRKKQFTLPWDINELPAYYAPITYGDFLANRIKLLRLIG